VAQKEKPRRCPRAAAKKVTVNPSGTPPMHQLGRNTIRCEVGDSLPDGVFYGMLGDVHPVCGNTHSDDPKKCELMMLGEQASTGPIMAQTVPHCAWEDP